MVKIFRKVMQNSQSYTEVVEKYIEQIEFPDKPLKLYDPIRYTLEQGGKRIRPVLILMVENMVSGKNLASALACAAAVELFHNFTLIHDDIMDNAEIRRGKKSVHAHWDSDTAILSGDTMVIWAYSELAKVDKELLVEVIREFSQMAITVCEGQQIDMDFEAMSEVHIDEYVDMIERKTAAIFSHGAKMGAIIGGADGAIQKKLYEFGREVGIAFQLQDDYLDVYGDAKTFGKEPGGDIEEGKKTFLLISAMNRATEDQRKRMTKIVSNSGTRGDKLDQMRGIYAELQIDQITRERVESHLRRSVEILRSVEIDSERKQELMGVVEQLRDRNK